MHFSAKTRRSRRIRGPYRPFRGPYRAARGGCPRAGYAYRRPRYPSRAVRDGYHFVRGAIPFRPGWIPRRWVWLPFPPGSIPSHPGSIPPPSVAIPFRPVSIPFGAGWPFRDRKALPNPGIPLFETKLLPLRLGGGVDGQNLLSDALVDPVSIFIRCGKGRLGVHARHSALAIFVGQFEISLDTRSPPHPQRPAPRDGPTVFPHSFFIPCRLRKYPL